MKLYPEEYSKIHTWKTMVFAVREWILREHHSTIVDDLKFLTRIWVNLVIVHNIQKNLWNNRFLSENIESKLPWVEVLWVPVHRDLYDYVLSVKESVDKLIILERQYLIWKDWNKVNTISTKDLSQALEENDLDALWVWNTNFRWALLWICKAVEEWAIHRAHILAWWRKNAIKHELFSLEWVWTLIWNDFWAPDIEKANESDRDIISWILKSNKWNKFLKPRSKEYISENIWNFRIAYIDWIPVWCVEIKQIDWETIELWALAVVSSFLSLRLWLLKRKFKV